MNERAPDATPADPDELEVAPGFAHGRIEGWIPDMASPSDLCAALEKAFDYRGDVTITRKDGSVIEGYVFDRRQGPGLAESAVRMMPRDSDVKIVISYAEIAALVFSGRDTAAGKSWEAWVRKYWEKKAAGATNIGLRPEALD
jgi:hypothetical protein